MEKKEMAKKTEGANSFKDSKGRVWYPRITLRVVRDFEQKAGVGLFEAVFEMLQGKEFKGDDQEVEGLQVGPRDLFIMAGKLFGNVGNLGFLLYEACRIDGVVRDEDGKEVSYDDFSEAMGKDEINSALIIALTVLFDFFPELGEGGETQSPFGFMAGGGKKSTS